MMKIFWDDLGMQYQLKPAEKERLIKAIGTVLAIPFIDDLEDFVWEAVFCYAKSVPLVDPLTSIRSKRLFDVVDKKHAIGWSAKAIQSSIVLPKTFELVIQRADIFKKASDLGFPPLSVNSSPDLLGKALMKHWIEEKVQKDALHQGVKQKRVCILIKSPKRSRFVYFEEDLTEYKSQDLKWQWTDETKTGLQGTRKNDNFLAFRWYPNQKQLFERFHVSKDAFVFDLSLKRLSMDATVDAVLERLNKL